jgi:hypothetical protein
MATDGTMRQPSEWTSANGSVKQNTESMRLVCRLYDSGTADLMMRSHAPYLCSQAKCNVVSKR